MRPRRARLGCDADRLACGKGALTSMRPRRARLGCQSRCGNRLSSQAHFNEAEARAPRMRRSRRRGHPPIASTSMRPRRARLGCRERDRARSRCDLRATSMRPRRARLGCHCHRRDHDPGRSFNEAEARAPRMPARRSGMPASRRTSMRPRRARLGCAARQIVGTRRPSGHFNEAEARAPRMLVRRSAT